MSRPARDPRSLGVAIAIATAILAMGATATPGSAAAADFPTGYEGYHTYAEVGAATAAVAAAHPDIAQRFSIGQSYRGRELWAMKISDNVASDEPEPEILYDGGHHADEHMGVEMALRIMHWLVDGYGPDPRITKIVDTREIWIVFMVNPDGVQHDIHDGTFHFWRKNRQPTPGSTKVGTDLNRNYGYRWGGGGLTSKNPAAITYRGPSAFSAPETRAMRDFLKSRVVGGIQQIRAHVTFHEYGRLVMWPYGYTLKDVPGDMTRDDHAALVAIGRKMAATSGYRAMQASDNYVTTGTTRDYAYGTYRIFSYTFELSTKDYPGDGKIAGETGRNKEAILYLAERAWCPLGVLGATVKAARCGAFDDDLEVARGWSVDPDGTDTALAATSGRFSRSNPASTSVERPQAARLRPIRLARPRHRRQGRRVGGILRSRRTNVGSVPRLRSGGRHGPAPHVPVRLRAFGGVHGRRQAPGDDRGRRRHADDRVHAIRQGGRRRRGMAHGQCRARRVGRPHDPCPVRGGRRRPREPGRGRDRRRQGHPPRLTAERRDRRAVPHRSGQARSPGPQSKLISGRGVVSCRAAARWPARAARCSDAVTG